MPIFHCGPYVKCMTKKNIMPHLESHMHIIRKKYQIFSKPAEKFLEILKNILNRAEKDDHNSHLSHYSM